MRHFGFCKYRHRVYILKFGYFESIDPLPGDSSFRRGLPAGEATGHPCCSGRYYPVPGPFGFRCFPFSGWQPELHRKVTCWAVPLIPKPVQFQHPSDPSTKPPTQFQPRLANCIAKTSLLSKGKRKRLTIHISFLFPIARAETRSLQSSLGDPESFPTANFSDNPEPTRGNQSSRATPWAPRAVPVPRRRGR